MEATILESELKSIFKIEQLDISRTNYLDQLDIEIKKLEKLLLFGLLPDEVPSDPSINLQKVEPTKNKDFTTKRQVLAMYYLFNEIGCTTATVDRTVQARFIEFMTGKNYDSIYKTLSDPFKALSNTKNIDAIKDMEYIKNQFINLELKGIAERIERDKKI